MNKITKAVIPCGGMGTRFLPITKAVAKEILPVIDTPVLSYIVDEAINSGITDILIVLGKGKEAIKQYFTPDAELEDKLCKAGKQNCAQKPKSLYSRAQISFVCQQIPKGSADAVYLGKSFTGDQPFALSWGDDLIVAEPPVISQLADAYYKYGSSVLGVQYFAGDDIVKYGVAEIAESFGRAHSCRRIVEKPPLSEIPSRYASLGRYIITPDIYKAIELTPISKGEYQFTDSLNILCGMSGVYAYEFTGKRYDMGDKFGAVQATVEFALKNPEFGDKMREYLKSLAKTL